MICDQFEDRVVVGKLWGVEPKFNNVQNNGKRSIHALKGTKIYIIKNYKHTYEASETSVPSFKHQQEQKSENRD